MEEGLGCWWVQVTPTSPGDLAVTEDSAGSLGVLGHAGCAEQWLPAQFSTGETMFGLWVQSGSSSRAECDRLEMLEPGLGGFYGQAVSFDSYLD